MSKKTEWILAGAMLGVVALALIWLAATGGFEPLPEEPAVEQAADQGLSDADDIAARTALGNAVVDALNSADVAAAITSVEIYHVGEATITLLQSQEALGSSEQVEGVAQGVAYVIFTNVPAADTVFVHDGNGKTIGAFER